MVADAPVGLQCVVHLVEQVLCRLDGRLGALAVADVPCLGQGPQASLELDDGDCDFGGKFGPVLPAMDGFDGDRRLANERLESPPVFLMRDDGIDVRERHLKQLLPGEPQGPAGGPVHLQEAPLLVQQLEAVACLLHHCVPAGLALQQGRFELPALSEVMQRDHDTVGPWITGSELGNRIHFQPHACPGPSMGDTEQPSRHPLPRGERQHGGVFTSGNGLAGPIDHIPVRMHRGPLQELVAGEAKKLESGVVHIHQASVRPLAEGALGHVLEEGPVVGLALAQGHL